MTNSFTIFRFTDADGAAEATLHDVVSTESLSSGELHFEGDDATYQYGLAFASLADAALSVPQSRELVSKTARRAWA